MPQLIPEILFAIAKQLIEDGDSEDAIIKFAVSGKEQLKALKNVLYSVTALKLYDDHFAIGWDKQCLKLHCDKLPKSLMYCIGGSVTNLHIDKGIKPILQPIIDAIVEKRKLISFSVGNDFCMSAKIFMTECLPLFSSTLKDLTLPSNALYENLRNELRPESLTFLNIVDPQQFYNIVCPLPYKKSPFINRVKNIRFKNILLPFPYKKSPFLNGVKNLSFTYDAGKFFYSSITFRRIVSHFSPLKTLHFNIKYESFDFGTFTGHNNFLIKYIKKSVFFPSKIVYNVVLEKDLLNIETIRFLHVRFPESSKFFDSNSKFHHFRRTIQTADSQTKLLEVFFPKATA